MARKWGVSKLLLPAAVVVFVLAAVGVKIGALDLVALGLASGFASFVIHLCSLGRLSLRPVPRFPKQAEVGFDANPMARPPSRSAEDEVRIVLA